MGQIIATNLLAKKTHWHYTHLLLQIVSQLFAVYYTYTVCVSAIEVEKSLEDCFCSMNCLCSPFSDGLQAPCSQQKPIKPTITCVKTKNVSVQQSSPVVQSSECIHPSPVEYRPLPRSDGVGGWQWSQSRGTQPHDPQKGSGETQYKKKFKLECNQ